MKTLWDYLGDDRFPETKRVLAAATLSRAEEYLDLDRTGLFDKYHDGAELLFCAFHVIVGEGTYTEQDLIDLYGPKWEVEKERA